MPRPPPFLSFPVHCSQIILQSPVS